MPETTTKEPDIADIQMFLEVAPIIPVPIPADCTDGFLCCYWGRPERYLDIAVQLSISSLAPEALAPGVEQLAHDIASGAWDTKYGHLRSLAEYDLGYRLVVAG